MKTIYGLPHETKSNREKNYIRRRTIMRLISSKNSLEYIMINIAPSSTEEG